MRNEMKRGLEGDESGRGGGRGGSRGGKAVMNTRQIRVGTAGRGTLTHTR